MNFNKKISAYLLCNLSFSHMTWHPRKKKGKYITEIMRKDKIGKQEQRISFVNNEDYLKQIVVRMMLVQSNAHRCWKIKN